MVHIEEIILNDDEIQALLKMSLEWEKEDIVYGYHHNSTQDLEGKRVFIAKDNDNIIGYLFGKEFLHDDTSLISKDSRCFDIEEIYVKKDYRSNNIGLKLFEILEQKLIEEEVSFITLSMASKNYKALLHFYIDMCDMDFWHAKLFKKLK